MTLLSKNIIRFHFARNYASFISREKNRPKWETFRLHGKTKSWLLSTLYVFFIFPKEPKRASFLLRWRHRPNWYTFPLHDLLAKLTNFDPANKKKFKFDSARNKRSSALYSLNVNKVSRFFNVKNFVKINGVLHFEFFMTFLKVKFVFWCILLDKTVTKWIKIDHYL